jgi:hypothetical protein
VVLRTTYSGTPLVDTRVLRTEVLPTYLRTYVPTYYLYYLYYPLLYYVLRSVVDGGAVYREDGSDAPRDDAPLHVCMHGSCYGGCTPRATHHHGGGSYVGTCLLPLLLRTRGYYH